MKNFVENNKKQEEEINEKKDYMEKIKNLEMKIKEITEEKSKIKSDFDKAFLDNKKLEINLVSKDEVILKLKDNIKYLEEQIKEKDKKIINNNDIIAEEINSNSSKKIKTKINNNVDIYTHNQMISQLKDDIKEKDNEIEYLKIEIQELKSKIEEYEDNFDNSSFKQNYELNERANVYEEKIKFLTERNEYYQKLLNENKIKIQNLENSNKNLNKEKEELKKNNQLGLNNFISDELNKKNYEKNNKEKNEYHPDKYIILSDKSYGDLKWYLLTEKKNINNKSDESLKFSYDNLLWVPKID
jgi:chromosome segregation ATPase